MKISRIIPPAPLNSLCRIARENNSVWENKRIPQTTNITGSFKIRLDSDAELRHSIRLELVDYENIVSQ